MKKLIYLLSVTFLLLQSCSSGDNSNPGVNVDNTLLMRKWYSVSSTYQGQTHYHTPCGSGNRDYIEFTSPDIYYEYYYKSPTDCSYVSEGPFKWVKNGDTIKFYDNGSLMSTATISVLSATTLKFVYTDTATQESTLYVYNSY